MARKTSLAGLPPTGTRRWVASRKAAVVAAVRQGLITIEEACRRYELSEEEFASWQRAFETHGIAGLRVTYLQILRGDRSSRLARTELSTASATPRESSVPRERQSQEASVSEPLRARGL